MKNYNSSLSRVEYLKVLVFCLYVIKRKVFRNTNHHNCFLENRDNFHCHFLVHNFHWICTIHNFHLDHLNIRYNLYVDNNLLVHLNKFFNFFLSFCFFFYFYYLDIVQMMKTNYLLHIRHFVYHLSWVNMSVD